MACRSKEKVYNVTTQQEGTAACPGGKLTTISVGLFLKQTAVKDKFLSFCQGENKVWDPGF